MICRLLVNIAFLAAGYYIGREVGRLSRAEDESGLRQTTDAPESDAQPTSLEEDAVSRFAEIHANQS